MERIYSGLSESNPLDVAVFACLASAFWATARLGELTVKNLATFDPKRHVKRVDVGRRWTDKASELQPCTSPRPKLAPLKGKVFVGRGKMESVIRRTHYGNT